MPGRQKQRTASPTKRGGSRPKKKQPQELLEDVGAERPRQSRELDFHSTLPPISRNTNRAYIERGVESASLLLRVRTTDSEPDGGLIAQIRKRIPEPELQIVLVSWQEGNYYEIFMNMVPNDKVQNAIAAVDRAALMLLEAKEMKQNSGDDTQQLRNELKAKKRSGSSQSE